MRRLSKIHFFLFIILLGITGHSTARDIRDNPGYVDFSDISIFKGHQPTVEVTLREPILRLLFALSEQWIDDEEKGFFSLLENVVIREYSTDPELAEKVVDFMNNKSNELEKNGSVRARRESC